MKKFTRYFHLVHKLENSKPIQNVEIKTISKQEAAALSDFVIIGGAAFLFTLFGLHIMSLFGVNFNPLQTIPYLINSIFTVYESDKSSTFASLLLVIIPFVMPILFLRYLYYRYLHRDIMQSNIKKLVFSNDGIHLFYKNKHVDVIKTENVKLIQASSSNIDNSSNILNFKLYCLNIMLNDGSTKSISFASTKKVEKKIKLINLQYKIVSDIFLK